MKARFALLSLGCAATLLACGARSPVERANDAAISSIDSRTVDSRGPDHALPLDACQPVCGARVCGPDPVCGSSCGVCPQGAPCSPSGTCGNPRWQVVAHPSINSLHDVWASGPEDVWMVGDTNTTTPGALRGIVLRYDGKSIKEVSTPPGQTLYGVTGLGPGDIWIVGEEGRILRRQNGGWVVSPPPTPTILFDVWAASATEAWAVGQSGVFRYVAATGTWVPEGSSSWKLTSISGKSVKDIWAVGLAAGVVHYDGKTWTLQAAPTWGLDPGAVWRGAGNDVWIVAAPNTVLRQHAGQWSIDKLPLLLDLGSMQAIHGTSNGDVWAAGFDGVAHFDGSQWSRSNETQGSFGIYAVAPDDVWLVGIKMLLRYH